MLKRLAKCVREYKWLAILSPLIMVGEVVFEVLIPYKMADLIDLGIEQGNMDVIKSIGTELIIFAFCAMAMGIVGGIVSAKASAGFATNVRHDMYYNIQRFSFANIDKFSTAGLVTRMTTDVTQVQQSFMMLIRGAFRGPLILVLTLFMSLKISTTLPKIFLVAVPILGVGLFIIFKYGVPLFQKMFKIYDKLNAVVQENVRGIRVVKAYVREEFEDQKFSNVSDELRRTGLNAERVIAFTSPLMEIAMYSVTLLMAWVGAKLVVSSELSTGQLTTMFTYTTRVLMAFLMFAMMVMMFAMSAASAKRIVEVLDEEPSIVNCENPVTEINDGSIEFKNVSMAYGKGLGCIKGVNLKIASGQTVGIIGGTGSGKSSLIYLIPRLYDTIDGEVLVSGVNVKNIDLDVLRSNVSIVLQKNLLFSGSVAENLRWGKADATEEEMRAALDLAQASSFVNKFEGGLEYHIEQGGTNVSGGQRQRLCIARAVIGQPKVLILDDSTSAVDTATEAKIREGLKNYLPKTTKIIIAQRISSVQEADMIIVLDNGQVSGIGTHDELLASNTIYREVYESQTKGGGDFDEPAAE